MHKAEVLVSELVLLKQQTLESLAYSLLTIIEEVGGACKDQVGGKKKPGIVLNRN